MTTMQQAALSAPEMAPHPNLKKGRFAHNYVCHSACIYWACRTISWANWTASRKAEKVAGQLCGHCVDNRVANCAVIPDLYYSELLFNTNTVAYNPAADPIAAGDVIVFGASLDKPMHSVVVVDATFGAVHIRGFNNFGTFQRSHPVPGALAYDPHDRPLSERVDPTANLYRVPQADYIAAVRDLLGGGCCW